MLSFISVLLGGGILSLVQFLISRYDKRHDTTIGITTKLDKISEKVDSLEEKIKESVAISCRVRILRFAGEMFRGIKHTKDDWDQVLTDITTYKSHCETHPTFKNDQTAATTEYLLDEYRQRLEKRDFLYIGGDRND